MTDEKLAALREARRSKMWRRIESLVEQRSTIPHVVGEVLREVDAVVDARVEAVRYPERIASAHARLAALEQRVEKMVRHGLTDYICGVAGARHCPVHNEPPEKDVFDDLRYRLTKAGEDLLARGRTAPEAPVPETPKSKQRSATIKALDLYVNHNGGADCPCVGCYDIREAVAGYSAAPAVPVARLREVARDFDFTAPEVTLRALSLLIVEYDRASLHASPEGGTP